MIFIYIISLSIIQQGEPVRPKHIFILRIYLSGSLPIPVNQKRERDKYISDCIMDYRNVPTMASLSDCGSSATHGSASEEDTAIIKKGPWTQEEDSILINHISCHGEGHWNSVARCAGKH